MHASCYGSPLCIHFDFLSCVAKQIPEGEWFCETCKVKEMNAVKYKYLAMNIRNVSYVEKQVVQ